MFVELKGQELFSDVWNFFDSINSFSVNMDYEHLSVSEYESYAYGMLKIKLCNGGIDQLLLIFYQIVIVVVFMMIN